MLRYDKINTKHVVVVVWHSVSDRATRCVSWPRTMSCKGVVGLPIVRGQSAPWPGDLGTGSKGQDSPRIFELMIQTLLVLSAVLFQIWLSSMLGLPRIGSHNGCQGNRTENRQHRDRGQSVLYQWSVSTMTVVGQLCEFNPAECAAAWGPGVSDIDGRPCDYVIVRQKLGTDWLWNPAQVLTELRDNC